LHQFRGSSDETGEIEPTEYDILTGGGSIRHELGRINLLASGEINVTDYDDNVTGLGVAINGDDRDRDKVLWSGRVGYEIMPGYEAFVRGTYNTVDYDDAVDDAGIDRDSHGYEVVSGLSVDFGGLIFGDFYGGYLSQNIDDPSLNNVKGLTYGAGLTWNPTGLTTVRLDIDRYLRETSLTGAAANKRTDFDLTVDHELLRNLLLQAETRLSQSHFKGLNRDDDLVVISAHANYLMNRRMNLFLGYSFEKEMSDVNTQDYERNIIRIRFTLKI
jgi:hypothetical protein